MHQVTTIPALGHFRTECERERNDAGRALRRVYTYIWVGEGALGVFTTTILNTHTVTDAIPADRYWLSPCGCCGAPFLGIRATLSWLVG